MASAPAINEPRLAPPNLNLAAALAKLFAAATVARNTVVASPKDPCSDIPFAKTALEKALQRASGTWGGFQASRPFIHLPRD